MKKRRELWMLAAAVLSVLVFAESVEIISILALPLGYLPFVLPVFPNLFLQLWLCRHTRRLWLRLLPILLLLLVAVLLLLGMATASGWDWLGYLILLLLCPAPAVGCGLGVMLHLLLVTIAKRKGQNQ